MLRNPQPPLLRYRETRSEEAFRELVAEHIDHVHGAALRRCGGNAAMARDVTQAVFCELACKASSLPAGTTVGGWLHRCAIYKSSEILRAETRRRRYEGEAARFQTAEDSRQDADASLWAALAPVLDGALEKLAPADRDALVLRYYERRSLREVGAELGLSDDAAQKRVTRALQRLRACLQQHGIASTAGALGAVLTTSAGASTAPAGMASALTLSALAPAAAPTATAGAFPLASHLFTLMTAKTKTFLLTAGFCVALTVPALLQHRTILRQQERIDQLEAGFPEPGSGLALAGAGRPSRTSPPRRNATASASAEGKDVAALRAIVKEADPLKRMASLSAFLQGMKPAEAPVLARLLREHGKAGAQIREEALLFMRAWGGIDGPAAMAFVLQNDLEGSEESAVPMSGWASRDPQGAVAWLAANPSGNTECFAAGIAHGWALHDLDAASRWIATRPPSDARAGMQEVLLQRCFESRGSEGAKEWFAGLSAQGTGDEAYRRNAFGGIATRLAAENPQEGLQWLQSHPEDARAASSSTLGAVLKACAQEDPRAAAEWALANPGMRGKSDPEVVLAEVVGVWTAKEPAAAGQWLGQLAGTADYDSAAGAYVKGICESDPASGFAWARTIGAGQDRTESLNLAARRWLQTEPEAARRALLAEGFEQEEIDRMGSK